MQTSAQIKRTQSGFTIMEVLIVVAIIGLVSAIAIPGYLSWKPGYLFRGAVSRVQGDLNRAKARTYETRRQCRVEYCATGVDYQIIDGDLAQGSTWTHAPLSCPMTAAEQAAYAAAGRQVTLRNLTGYPGVTITPGTQPVFSPRGTATVGSLTVVHPRFPLGASVTVNIIGRVNVTWN
jgi:prepilin-type N-terminal cleavage/methylation domain-containing protein